MGPFRLKAPCRLGSLLSAMFLKNLTVLGFKSFAEKTSVNFLPGMTAIVGPNGCGKSNVSDAIRWVLGEQSAKALRGGEMADVIFNGTDTRKPLSLAEVSLTIGDVDEEHLKAAGVEIGYNEVTITRRVYRDGGSEYFLNKTSCRLRDIQQFFAGTGMGKTSYSIMAQGNITQILSVKPDDRRLVFEEAAGITKFKAQKKEALRKLEHTDQNLLRVQDLIKEVKRQIGSLQRQAGKAKRYKSLMVELLHLDTQLARHQFDILQGEIGERTVTAEKAKVELEVVNESVLRCEDEILQLRSRQSELEQDISLHQQQGLEIKALIDRHDNRIRINEERLLELEEQNLKALQEIAEAEERKRTAEAELVQVNERLAVAQEQLALQRVALEEKRQDVQAIESDLSRVADGLRRAQSEAFNNGQQLSRARNEINALDLQQQGNVIRLEKLNSEKIQVEEETARLNARLTEFEVNVEAEKLSVQTARGTVEERQARLRELQQELQQAGHELDQLVRQQAEKKSRLNVLEQLDTQHEGFGAGALAALKQSQNVLGSLADKIRVPDQYIAAVEAALGQNLQLVLTEQPEAAQTILDDLRNNKKGKASIAALALRGTGALACADQPIVPSGATPALSVIEIEDASRPLIEFLLGSTLIVANLAAATAGFLESSGAFDFVTTDGELLNRAGIFTGGSAGNGNNGKAPSSILGRKNQIAELQSQLAALASQVEESSRQRAAIQSEQTVIQASIEQARTELRQQEVAVASREGEFRALQNSQRQLAQKVQNVTFELNNLSGADREAAEKRAQFAARIAELENQELGFSARVAELAAELEQLRGQRDAANAALTEARVTLTGEEQQAGALGRQRIPLEARIRELGQLIEVRRREGSSFIGRKEQFENEIAESRSETSRLVHEREQNSLQTAELVDQKRGQDADIGRREEELRGQRRRLTDLQTLRGQLDVELTQKSMAVQNLRERVQQKYQLNLDDVRSECITITDASEGLAKVETLTAEEMQSRGLSTDWDKVAEQVSVLQKRVDEMGPVNLVAIEEYDETEQRYNFLNQQNDDLVNAKTQLMDVLGKINTQTKEMFLTTFHQIRDNFRAMFTEIFGGGKADLILQEGEDPLEAGIEIVARPPGKQLQSITLLSGGEQTMTAVALLFSIYQVKPSPFCVLDELDAPLDESNINRFIKVLQRFLTSSQFIVITHNKRTIGMADALYGVTMQEHGISKLVSVKFHKSDEQPEAIPANSRPLVPERPEAPGSVSIAETVGEAEVVMAK